MGSQSDTRTYAVFSVSARQLCSCPAAVAAAARVRTRVRGRTMVLDWAGEWDRRWQGLHDLCGLLRRLWVLNLRDPGLTGVGGSTWYLVVVCGRRNVGTRHDGSARSEVLAVLESGYWAPKRSLFDSFHLLVFNYRHIRQLPFLLGIQTNANTTNNRAH